MKILLPLSFAALFAAALFPTQEQDELRRISERIWHLGNDATPEWTEAPAEPDGEGMQVSFQGRAFEGEGVLLVRQRDVHNVWHIELNGQRIAQLITGDQELTEHHYAIPAGLIQDGDNLLRLVGETPSDDILFGDLRYREASVREHFNLRRVRFYASHVVEGRRRPLAARFTLTDVEGNLVHMFYGEAEHTAVRKGVIYSKTGEAHVELPPGDYHLYASRGMEWSRGKINLHIAHDSHPEARYGAEVELAHEVPTPGFVAADTHIHTLTHSGHGDASMEERQITLVGEGVELAIATDHNHNTDYAPIQQRMGLSSHYTAVVGNEVTTPIGHFNAFPLKANDPVPEHQSKELPVLLASMRERGAKAIILNHPRWPDGEDSPFARIGLDARTGEWSGDWGAGYDALELINSDTHAEDPLLLYRDWFGLLNRGQAVVAVGASDSHAVGVVVGQGRTYVESASEEPGKLDVVACSEAIAAGRSSVSMGIYAALYQGERSVMGARLQASEASPLPTGLELRVHSPSWVTPKQLLVFANGSLILSKELNTEEPPEPNPYVLVVPEPFAASFALGPELELPRHDYWLVAVVLGAGVEEPFWPLRNDYTLASTNPVYIDVDGDGAYTSPRELAQRKLSAEGSSSEAVLRVMQEVDAAVAAQVLHLVREDYHDQADARASALNQAILDLHPNLEAWIGGPR